MNRHRWQVLCGATDVAAAKVGIFARFCTYYTHFSSSLSQNARQSPPTAADNTDCHTDSGKADIGTRCRTLRRVRARRAHINVCVPMSPPTSRGLQPGWRRSRTPQSVPGTDLPARCTHTEGACRRALATRRPRRGGAHCRPASCAPIVRARQRTKKHDIAARDDDFGVKTTNNEGESAEGNVLRVIFARN